MLDNKNKITLHKQILQIKEHFQTVNNFQLFLKTIHL